MAGAEAALRGTTAGAQACTDAERLAAEAANPVTDVRASSQYRREALIDLTAQALGQAWERCARG
jgi:CO/xanthine dehydrogenase FAD-binding subunit